MSTRIVTPLVVRLAVIWARASRCRSELFIDNRPGEPAVRVGVTDEVSTCVMPLTARQARELAHELTVRADLIDPKGAGRVRG